jgi:hypothetical protein
MCLPLKGMGFNICLPVKGRKTSIRCAQCFAYVGLAFHISLIRTRIAMNHPTYLEATTP